MTKKREMLPGEQLRMKRFQTFLHDKHHRRMTFDEFNRRCDAGEIEGQGPIDELEELWK